MALRIRATGAVQPDPRAWETAGERVEGAPPTGARPFRIDAAQDDLVPLTPRRTAAADEDRIDDLVRAGYLRV